MIYLGDSCPECGGSLQDGGCGNLWACRVCEASIETDGDGVVLRIDVPVPREEWDDDPAADLVGQEPKQLSEDEVAAVLGDLFGNLER